MGPVLLYLGFYASYFGTAENWWSLRFILPVAPILVAGGILAFERLVSPLFRRLLASVVPREDPHVLANRFAWGAALVFLAAFTMYAVKLNHSSRFMNWGHADGEYRVAAEKLETLVAPNSVCLCMQTSGSLYYYTNLILVRHDQFDGERAQSFFGWARRPASRFMQLCLTGRTTRSFPYPLQASGAWSQGAGLSESGNGIHDVLRV